VADNDNDYPEAVATTESRRRIQLVWLIPLLAALVGGWLAVKAILDRGPAATITFKTADGLEANKTKIKYKDVDVGIVSKVELAKDLERVIVTAQFVKGTEAQLVEDTKFWVVRPRISGGSVSGLGTLLSGAYIGVSIGKSNRKTNEFTGLETPPVFEVVDPGREFVLHSPDLGSLDVGEAVFFRRLQVGQISAYELDKDGKGVTLRAFIKAPYDQFVTRNTRFFHASGVDVQLNTDGIKVNTQSLVSIVLGGIAFQTPIADTGSAPAEAMTAFELFATHEAAMKDPDPYVDRYVLVFHESLRGLVPGAPVDFRGITIGEVVSINTRIDMVKRTIELPVEVKLFPDRLVNRQRAQSGTSQFKRDPRKNMTLLAERGMRAQVRTGNLLTGQLYIAMDFFPRAPKAQIKWDADPPELPTIPGELQDLKTSLESVVQKLNKVDYEGISTDVKDTLKSTTKMIKQLDTTIAELSPELKAMVADARDALISADRALKSADNALGPDSPVLQDSRATMQEFSRAAQSFRNLADYLEQHPEALISGKKADDKDNSVKQESKEGEKK